MNENINGNDFNFNNDTNVEIKAMGQLAEGFTVIPNNIMNDMPDIKAEGFMVFAKILQYVNSKTNKISVAGLSKLTGLTKGRVSKGLNNLISLGYIKRYVKYNGNIKNGYVYEIYGERQPIDEELRETVGNTRRIENWDTETQYTENTYNKKENRKKEKEKKENKDVVDVDVRGNFELDLEGKKANEKLVKENMIIELYKTYKIQSRVMPQMRKLLLTYSDKMDLELYEEIFMLASEDHVKSKYKYIQDLLVKFDTKGIYTLEAYKLNCEEFKSSKKVNISQSNSKSNEWAKNGSKRKPFKTRFHGVCNTLENMGEDEVEETLAISQYKKFNNTQAINKVYRKAIEKGLNSLSTEEVRQSIINYAIFENLEIPK